MAATTRTNRRSYDASRRRAQAESTVAAVLEAAAEQFVTRGWTVGMRDIAQAAGVSVETVYATVGNKAALLLRVLELAGSERPEVGSLGQGRRAERVAAVAHLITAFHQRTAELRRTLSHAATGDPALAERWSEYDARQRAWLTLGVRQLLGRPPDLDLVDGMAALGSPEVYLQLTESAGWSPEKYRRWLADRIDQLLP
ncbi:TetR/AcrR family transcriptional regulator [Nocardioides sp. SR21]|uniref:TetR/AcrR family transcriptional regulator n=1 Tax=Nocardioides sp. SR21 TaxID=2919501 RepID=UPI001FA9ED0A|nr:TetR family transcriptional regulator [Nocardioides sp. SR21]